MIGALRTPEFPLLVAGRQGFPPNVHDDVEIETAYPVLILRIIDDANRRRHADAFQRRLVKKRDAFRGRILHQDLDADRLARGIHQFALAYVVAGFLQKLHGLAQIATHRFRIAADGIGIGRGKDL